MRDREEPTRGSGRLPVSWAPAIDREFPRRLLLRASFWTGLALASGGALAMAADYTCPRPATGEVFAGNVRDFPRGGPPTPFPPGFASTGPHAYVAAAFWFVNLDPADSARNGSGGGSGFLALSARCTHLSCTVQWRPERDFDGVRGWFFCPCHGATYTRAGVRVYGPAVRSMDTLRVSVDANGDVLVRTDAVTPGEPWEWPADPRRAIPPTGRLAR